MQPDVCNQMSNFATGLPYNSTPTCCPSLLLVEPRSTFHKLHVMTHSKNNGPLQTQTPTLFGSTFRTLNFDSHVFMLLVQHFARVKNKKWAIVLEVSHIKYFIVVNIFVSCWVFFILKNLVFFFTILTCFGKMSRQTSVNMCEHQSKSYTVSLLV